MYILLWVALPLVLLLSWRVAFSETLALKKDINRSEKSMQRYPDPEGSMEALRSQLQSLQKNHVSDPELIDEELMEVIGTHTKGFNLCLEEIPETHHFTSENYHVQTFRVRLSGNYRDLIRFIYFSEDNIRSCQVISLHFQRELHRKRGEKLCAELYFQSIHRTQ